MTKSDPPRKSISSDKIHAQLTIPWKGIPWKIVFISVAAILTGAGGYTLNDLKNGHNEEVSETPPEYHIKFVKNHNETHKSINDTLTNTSTQLGQIMNSQIRQEAKDEARRISSKIGNREKREEKFDWLLEQNLKRLKAKPPREPCRNLNCTN